MIARLAAVISTLILSAFSAGGLANAAEIKCFFPLSLQHAAGEIIPQFERASGNKVTIAFSTAGAVADKVKKDEPADVAISGTSQIDDLQKQGKIVAGSAVRVAKVGVGVLVRKGAPKPDLSTVEAFKAAMLKARAISYTDPALGGPVGIYVDKLWDQLGIGPEMKLKTKLSGPGAAVSTTVVNGEADVGFIMVNEIVVDPRVDYVGPLPAPIQKYTIFAAGIVAGGGQKDGGRSLISFLSSPSSLEVLKKAGFDPP